MSHSFGTGDYRSPGLAQTPLITEHAPMDTGHGGMRGSLLSGGVRHGSGAPASRSDRSQQRRGRQRTPSPSRRAFMPGGPITATEWDDMVQNLQRQIYQMGKTLADHAHTIGLLKAELQQSTVPTIVQRIHDLETSVTERFASVDSRFNEGGTKVDARLNAIHQRFDVLTAEIRVFASGVQRSPTLDPPPGVDSIPISTPAPTNPWAHLVGQHAQSNVGHQFGSPAPAAAAPNGQNQNDFGVASPISSYGMNTGGGMQQQPNAGMGNGAHVVGGNIGVHPPNVSFGVNNVVNNGGGQWARSHNRQSHVSYSTCHAPMWNSYDNQDYVIGKKFVNELPIFNGDHSKYSHWKNKLTDHCCDTNPYWRALLQMCQETQHTIEYAPLANSRYGRFTGWDLSLDLWNFMSKRLGQDIYDRRLQLANNVEGNGFELWRALFTEYEGSDEYIALDGRTQLQNFPKIQSTTGITQHLNDWSSAMLKYGKDIGPVTRMTMFLKILPESLRTDVLKNGYQNAEAAIAWIKKTNVWTDREHRLKLRKGAVSAVTLEHSSTAQPPGPGGWDVAAPAQPTPGVTPELIAAVVAAVGQQSQARGRRPQGGTSSPRARSQSPASAARASFPKDACYHCKGKGHSRTANEKAGRKGCPEFAKILAANNDQLPKGYKGAFEKHVEEYKAKLKKPKVAAVSDGALNDEDMLKMLADEDDSDSDCDAPLRCGAVWRSTGPPKSVHFAADFPLPTCDPIRKTRTSNAFGALADVSPSEETIEALATELRSCAHRVTTSSAKQSKPKDWIIESDADVDKFQKLLCGTSQRNATKALRHLNLESELDDAAAFVERKSTRVNAKCRRVWAMVDSGSFVTIANCSKVFPNHIVHPSPGSIAGVTYSNASGGDIANRGQVVITHRMDNGSDIDIPFQDGDVQIPIVSVKDFVHKKTRVKFKDLGGTMKLPTGSVLPFVEKFGVYFIGLNVVDPVDTEPLNSPPISSTDVESSSLAIAALDNAIQALAVEDLSHLDVDRMPSPPMGFNSHCGDDKCRDSGCRRGLVRRPGRKSSFTRPVP